MHDSKHRFSRWTAAALGWIVVSTGSAFAQGDEGVTYTQQRRHVLANTCTGHYQERVDAPDFGPFDARVEAHPEEQETCDPSSQAWTYAEQHSRLEPRLMSAFGEVAGSYYAMWDHGGAGSGVDVTFTVPRRMSYDFLLDFRGGLGISSFYQVRLFRGDEVVFDWEHIDDYPDWNPLYDGYIEPGVEYRLYQSFSDGVSGADYDWTMTFGERPSLDLVQSPCPEGGTARVEWFDAAPGGDESGHGTQGGPAPAQACGGFLQLLDLTTCEVSNVVAVE